MIKKTRFAFAAFALVAALSAVGYAASTQTKAQSCCDGGACCTAGSECCK